MGRPAGSAGRNQRLADGAGRTRAAAKSNRPVALVTGAANGIGRAISHHLLDAGWCVLAVDLPKMRLIQHFRGWARSAATMEGDVSDEDVVREAVRFALDRFGRLDAVVANAGIMIRRPIRRLSLEDWHHVIDTNLTAAFLLARAAQRALRSSKGSIVTIASTRALMSEPNTESYSASKGGLLALTHALAISLGPDIRVNCVSPGWIATSEYSKLKRKDHAQYPAGRVGKPQDVAEIVAFLLDREKSGFVTGANFVVDGGMTRKMIYCRVTEPAALFFRLNSGRRLRPMIFRQLFDQTSGTYSYLLASRRGGEALIIDPVLEKVDRYLQLVQRARPQAGQGGRHPPARRPHHRLRRAARQDPLHHRDGRADQGRRGVDAACRRRQADHRGARARRDLHARPHRRFLQLHHAGPGVHRRHAAHPRHRPHRFPERRSPRSNTSRSSAGC